MRKPRTIILVFIVFALVPGLLLLYVYRMPSIKSIMTISINQDFYKGASYPLQTKQIQPTHPKEGTKLDGYGYTITLKEYKNFIDKSQNKSLTRTYVDDNKRFILMFSQDYYSKIGLSAQYVKDTFYKNEKDARQIDAAVGRHLETEYDCYNAMFSASAKDMSLFNNEINEGLVQLLTNKAALASGSVQAIYQFDNEVIKGFILTGNNANGIFTQVISFRPTDLNTEYRISFVGKFTSDEVDAAISTIAFEQE